MPPMLSSLPILPLLPIIAFVGAFIAVCMPAGSRTRPAAVAAAATFTALLLAIAQFGRIRDGEIVKSSYAWLPEFGLDIVWRMDGLAWVFTIMVLGIGLLVLLYARYYM